MSDFSKITDHTVYKWWVQEKSSHLSRCWGDKYLDIWNCLKFHVHVHMSRKWELSRFVKARTNFPVAKSEPTNMWQIQLDNNASVRLQIPQCYFTSILPHPVYFGLRKQRKFQDQKLSCYLFEMEIRELSDVVIIPDPVPTFLPHVGLKCPFPLELCPSLQQWLSSMNDKRRSSTLSKHTVSGWPFWWWWDKREVLMLNRWARDTVWPSDLLCLAWIVFYTLGISR